LQACGDGFAGQNAGMNPFRLVLVIVAGCCLLRPASLPADDVAPPFEMEKHYSADLVITTKEGMAIQSKTYVDGDKMRSDVTMNGVAMAIIVRKDKRKIYQVMEDQKMVMEMPYDPDKFQGRTAASFGPEGTFVLVGPDTVDGVACTKYKVTSDKTKQVFFFWLDVDRKVPVQMATADGSLTVKWTNFTAGPQDASLFEVPEGYQVMTMPGGSGQ
jgi:outer membrane lipoprotein-sorting protein